MKLRRARLICLDLDDTLWDLGPVLEEAEHQLHEWLVTHWPRVTRRHDVASIRALRAQVAAEHPAAHDMSALRLETYRRLAVEAGYPESMASEAFELFQSYRNRVRLFDDVQPALDRLAAIRPLVAMTNGNADLVVIGLSDYFQGVFTARDLGAAKPDPRFFSGVCVRLGVMPEGLVHAGNDPEHDIAAASAAGMQTVWVNRRELGWPLAGIRPDHEVHDLLELAGLLES